MADQQRLRDIVLDKRFCKSHTNPKTLVAELSSVPEFEIVRLYQDACDEGVHTFTPRGNRVSWYLDERVKRDGDVLTYRFKPDFRSKQRIPAVDGWTLVFFND